MKYSYLLKVMGDFNAKNGEQTQEDVDKIGNLGLSKTCDIGKIYPFN